MNQIKKEPALAGMKIRRSAIEKPLSNWAGAMPRARYQMMPNARA